MAKTVTFLFTAAFIFLLTSCFEIECIDRPEAKVKAVFYDYDTKKAAQPDSVTIYGMGKDLKLYDDEKKLSLVYLPLKAAGNKTEFVIRINGTADTIQFVHSNSLQLISKECGYFIFHAIDSIFYTVNAIDSISLINSEVNFKSIEHVAIYF